MATNKKAAKTKRAASRPAARADLGAPIAGWFAKQPQPQRAIAEALRELIREAAPDAVGSLKWGMPFFENGGMMCAIGGHKGHVNLILSGPPEAYPDPDGRLEGDGKTGRHLKLRTLEELPRAAVKRWLKTAATLAKGDVMSERTDGRIHATLERGAAERLGAPAVGARAVQQ